MCGHLQADLDVNLSGYELEVNIPLRSCDLFGDLAEAFTAPSG
jgi:hypothetical protein